MREGVASSPFQARLRDRHQELLKRKLFFLKQQQLSSEDKDRESSPLFPGGTEGDGGESEETVKSKRDDDDGTTPGPSGTAGEEPDTLIDEDDLLKRAYEDYESGAYSPKLLKVADVEEVCGLSDFFLQCKTVKPIRGKIYWK